MIMPCVGILSPIIMDTSSSSTNQINTCRSTDFGQPEINSTSSHTLENSDYMGSGHRKSSNNNIDINNSSKAQNCSPDLSHLSYTMVSTPQPPPLDLSNIPNSPSKSQTIDFMEVSSGMILNSPKTTGSLETNTTSTTVTVTVTTTVSSTADTIHDTSINSKSNMKCEVNSNPQDLNPIVPTIEKLANVNWIEALKQYTEPHMTIKTNTNESNLDNEIDLTKTSEHNNNNKLNNEQINFNSQTSSPDLTAHFQAILTNLSEFLFNSSQLTNFPKNPMIGNLSYSSPSSATTTSVSLSNSSTSQINSDNLKFDNRNQQSTSLSNSIYPQNYIEHQTGYNMFNAADLSSTNPSLAITASLLSLLVGGQKPSPFLEQPLPQPSTYSKCPISSPKSYQSPDFYPQQFLGNTSIVPPPQPSPSLSQVPPSKFPKSSVTLQHMPLQSSLSPHRSLAATSCPLVDLPNLNESKSSDPRDLLYQLGQQLMAMATSGINGTRPSLDLWNMSNTDGNYNSLNLTSLSNRSNPAYIQPHINSSTGHIPEQVKSPSLPSSSSLVPSVTSSSYNTSGLEKSFHHIPPPLQQHHPNTNTGPFSGISMRGNQKYSAYYQHQRKQGFQTGGMNEYVNNTVGRRQRNSLSPLSTNTRYVGRRLRSGLNNTLLSGTNLEMRNSQRFPAIRNQTASTGNTASTTNSNSNNTGNTVSSSGNSCANFRGNTSYRMMSNIGNLASSHVLNPIKSHLQTENMNNTTHGHVSSNNNSNNNSSQQTTRHRETAFICSCGKDFESLYIFTLHMKDTGHKPKCDQAEKDIPKLVRGQDMWINSETEQTREILRCMRCHQSFRSLPELTMHMMKTNHYSEIVYNDSGRCVFVNPDDNRRGSGSTAGSSHYSGSSNLSHTPGKSGLSVMGTFGGRRSHRNMNMNWLNNTQTNNSNARLSSNEELNSVMKQSIKQHTLTCDKYDTDNSGEISKRFGHLDDEKHLIKSNQLSTSKEYCEEGKNEDEEIQDVQNNINSLPSPTSSQLGVSLSPSSTLCKTEEENQQSAKSSLVYDDTLNKITRKQDTELLENENNNNVLQKVESFAEISINNNNLSTKNEFSNQNFIQSTSPESVISVVERNSPTMRLSPKLHRKRTYSEAGISINSVSDIPTSNTSTSVDTVSCTPTSSPITTSRNELNYDDKLDFDMTVDAKQVIPSTSNSSNTSSKVSSTSEMNKNFSESPLSSLQKLVDTTHKPVKSSSILNSSSSTNYSSLNLTNNNIISSNTNNNKFSRSLGLTNTTTVHSQYSPNKSGMNTCPNSPYSVHSTISSGKIQTSPLSSPIAENDNLIPALSALYAYVERSSSSSTQLRDNQCNFKNDLVSPNNGSNNNNDNNNNGINNNNSNNNSNNDNCELNKDNLPFNNPDKLNDMNSSVSSPSLLNHLSTSTINSNAPNYPCNNDNATLLSSQSSPQHSAVMSQMLPTFPIPTHPLIQAIYDAAMSNLAGQYLNPQISTCSSNTSMNDPLNTFKYAVMNFKEALDSFEVSSTNTQTNVIQTPPTSSTTTTPMLPSIGNNNGNDGHTMDLANNWLNMLRLLVESTEKSDGINSGCCKSINSYSESPNSNMSTALDRFGSHRLDDFTQHSSNSKSLPTTAVHEQSTSSTQQKMLPSLQNDSMHLNYSLAMNRNRSNYSYNPTLPSSSSPMSTTVMNTPNMLAANRSTNIPSSFHSVINRNLNSYTTANNNNNSNNISSNINNTNNNNIMTTITKKAKCHFCGKPFANKGQVRLHISKNKCPCLLQQSCHVAALTAAFGSSTNNNTNTVTNNNNSSVRKMPQSVGTVKSNPVNTYLSSTVSKRNNNITGGNTIIATTNNSNVSQTFTDSIHHCTSNSLGSNSKDDLTSAPSALSLLKERFQNYDVNQNSTNYPNFSSYLPTNVSNSVDLKLTPTSSSTITSLSSSNNVFPYSSKTSTASMPISSSMSNISWLGGLNCTPSFPTSQLNKDAEFMNTSIPGTASTAAAVNAGHLAAMALLAQTLVQLKNASQSPSTSNTPLSQLMDSVNSNISKTNMTSPKPNSSENLSESNNPLLPLIASNLLNLKPSNQTIQSGTPFNFNLESLFNQMNMAKQLNSFNWPMNNQAVNIDDNQSYRQPQQSQQQQPQN